MSIKVSVNGESRAVPEGLYLDSLLALLTIDAGRVAVELNRRIVRKADWPTTPIEDGATLEIVTFVGGGK